MTKKIRWGILSTARIGRNAVIPALQASPMAEVLAVASRDGEKAASFAKDLNIPRSYEGYETLLADPDIDAVYNPLPNHLHYPWTVRAAEAGKHILCEKPLALNVEQCEQMITATRTNGVQLMEAFMYRYHPRILEAHQMVKAGNIGEIRTIESAFCFMLTHKDDIRLKPEMGGGALMDVGCYCVNLSRLLAGREPVSVNARANWNVSGVDDQLTGIIDFGEGLMAHFDCGFNQASRQHCMVSGTEGYLELPMAFNMGTVETHIHRVTDAGHTHDHAFPAVDMYRLMAEDFMQAIAGRPLRFPIEDALGNMRVIQALLISANQDGSRVTL
jgi:predicted dehydrogenase